MRIVILFVLSFSFGTSRALQHDTVRLLKPVLIHAYGQGSSGETAAAVDRLEPADLSRFSNTTILPALNTVPGVRMEERSPGSYRLSIRGSLLRSPFGIRNVKVYWNGLPLTDGGGNTYLNLLDFGSFGHVEIVKGPASSLYGAGTGGVVLLNSASIENSATRVDGIVGSYGLRRLAVTHDIRKANLTVRLHASGHHADGYREQSAMDRYGFHADIVAPAGKNGVISTTFFFSHLYYQTPGGLTQDQYDANPRQARPASGPNRSAVEQKAAVYNSTPYLGFSYERDWNTKTSTTVGVFGSHSAFRNPAVRNYEARDETNTGIRTETQHRFGNSLKHRLTFGAEFQYFLGPVRVYDNDYGSRGDMQVDDRLTSTLGSIFAQATWELFPDAFLTLGGSINTANYNFTRRVPQPSTRQVKAFDPFVAPRIAAIKKVGNGLAVFANISRGFSPPSLAEVRPSTNAFNGNLQAERGTVYEMGARGETPDRKFSYEIVGYDFGLRETIVVQRLGDGADYFINAGRTSQRGLELMVRWKPLSKADGIFSGLELWTTHAYSRYRFVDYVNDDNDFSGNELTGVPEHANTTGLDATLAKGFYANLTASNVSRLPLNDANDVYADAYLLVGLRAGYRRQLGNHDVEIFAGVDNALNQKYSLGNDLNAVMGGRYFNAAAPRNYYAGVTMKFFR